MTDDAASRSNPRWRRVGLAVGVIALALIVVTTVLALVPYQGPVNKRRGGTENNIRSLLLFMIDRRTRRPKADWPPYSGKNFVLSVVATRDVDIRRRENLEILWPEDAMPDDLGPQDYADVTKAALRTQRFPQLTGFAGRRNADPRYRVTKAQEAAGTILIACRHRDGILAGYSGGDVRFHSRRDLGLPEGAPLVFGDEAPEGSILRLLSAE